MNNNLIILNQMKRLSGLIKDLKEVRCKLTLVKQKVNYFVVNGETSNALKEYCDDSVSKGLFLEQYLRLSVSNSCKHLDGFDASKMDPIDYISSNDVKDKYVDICRGKKIVATINLTTGEIEPLKPECNND